MSTTETTAEVTTTEETTVEPTTEKVIPKTFDEDYVKGLRDEAAAHRTKLRAKEAEAASLAEKVAEFERAQLSEKERFDLEFGEAKTKAQKLEAQIRDTLLEASVAKNVRKFDLADADAAFKLLDRNSVEYGDDGRPTNIDEVLAAAIEKYPMLKLVPEKKSVVDPGTTSPGKARSGGGLSRESIKAMSEKERQERMPEILAWTASGYGKK